MDNLEKIIAVVPAFNEEDTIRKVMEGIKEQVDEQILIDDCSYDDTANIANEYGLVIQNTQKEGYDACLNKGFKLAKDEGADIIITLDADGEHSPGEIPLLIGPIRRNEADLVVGRRPYPSRFMEKIFGIYGEKTIGISDPLCGMKAYHVKVYNEFGFFDDIRSIGTQLTFLASLKGYRVGEIPIRYFPREDSPRFGNQLSGNWKLFLAYLRLKNHLETKLNELDKK